MARNARQRRNQQIASIVLSLLVVISMGLSLVAVFAPRSEPVTPAPIFITVPPQLQATPTPTPAPDKTPAAPTAPSPAPTR